MKLTRIALAGGMFGAAAIVGGIVAVAKSGESGADHRAAAIFSTERLAVLDTDTVQLPAVDGIEAIDDLLQGAPLHPAAATPEATVWLSETSDGSICVVARDVGGYAATCGDVQQVATGKVVMRIQNAATDPALFVGIAPNDLAAASVGSVDATVTNNVWVAVAGPSDDTYTVSGSRGSVTVDMGTDASLSSVPTDN